MTNEQWKPAPGYPRYEVSNWGRLRCGSRMLSLSPASTGYIVTRLARDGQSAKTVSVHRLVTEAFLGPPQAGQVVNHKNGDKTDNRSKNLEWCSRSENGKHSYASLGRVAPRGSRNVRAKLTEDAVTQIRQLRATTKVRELAERFCVSKTLIIGVCNRKVWRHV